MKLVTWSQVIHLEHIEILSRLGETIFDPSNDLANSVVVVHISVIGSGHDCVRSCVWVVVVCECGKQKGIHGEMLCVCEELQAWPLLTYSTLSLIQVSVGGVELICEQISWFWEKSDVSVQEVRNLFLMRLLLNSIVSFRTSLKRMKRMIKEEIA